MSKESLLLSDYYPGFIKDYNKAVESTENIRVAFRRFLSEMNTEEINSVVPELFEQLFAELIKDIISMSRIVPAKKGDETSAKKMKQHLEEALKTTGHSYVDIFDTDF